MERMKMLKECLMNKLTEQMGHLEDVDAKEMGEVVDMVKDLTEAEYYCEVVKSMKRATGGSGGVQEEGGGWYDEEEQPYRARYDRGEADRGGMSSSRGSNMTGGRANSYNQRTGNTNMSNTSSYERGERDLYYNMMEDLNPDLGLENYMSTMSQHLTRMIQEATPEEKHKLKETLTTLVGKIK